MSHPWGEATGNAVIAAAVAREVTAARLDAYQANPRKPKVMSLRWTALMADYEEADQALRAATQAHRAATAVKHTQGPDIDADFQCPSTIAGGREDRCGLFRFPPRCKPGACTMKDAT